MKKSTEKLLIVGILLSGAIALLSGSAAAGPARPQ